MKLKRAVISVCTWTFSVLLAAAAQSIAEDRPPQTSPDTTVVDNAIKEKLESASTGAGASSPLKASSSQSRSRTNHKHRSTGIDFLGPVSSRWNADGSCTAARVYLKKVGCQKPRLKSYPLTLAECVVRVRPNATPLRKAIIAWPDVYTTACGNRASSMSRKPARNCFISF